jgi:hypothetical protein
MSVVRTYLESLLGAPYVWWREGDPVFELGPPFYTNDPIAPAASTVKACGTNCAGLVNCARLKAGLPAFGGTSHWQEALLPHWKPFDPDAVYPAMSLVFRPFFNQEDQGHLAILWTSNTRPAWQQKLLHSSSAAGVSLDDTLQGSHAWAADGYYKFVCAPEHWLGVNF